MEEKEERKDTIKTLCSIAELAQFLKDNPGKIVSVEIQLTEVNADAEGTKI